MQSSTTCVMLPWNTDQRNLSDKYPFTIDESCFKNSYGFVRWWLIRSAYDSGAIDIDYISNTLYPLWRDSSEYFMLNALDSQDTVLGSVFVKACKRGNDVYKALIKSKFSFLDGLPPIYFFTDDAVDKRTPMLFVTLTVDTKKYSLDEAWNNISDELNLFETKLRQKYGKFVKFRVWESHESGYPHSHIAYFFLDTEFIVFKDKHDSWRIADKHRKAIGRMWGMSDEPRVNFGVDVQAVQDTIGAFSEVQKYITKNIWSDKNNKTNTCLSLFNKQSYWITQCNYNKKILSWQRSNRGFTVDELAEYISANVDKWAKRDFIGAIWGTSIYMQYYNQRAEGVAEPRLNALVTTTMCNYNNQFPEIARWVFVGFILGSDLCQFVPKFNDEWAYSIQKPPPGMYRYIDFCVGDTFK